MKKTRKIIVALSSLALAAALSSCIFFPQKEESLTYSKDWNKVTIGDNVYKLKWSDEFDQEDGLDTSNWNRVVWAKGHVNNEVQAYKADEKYSKVSNGTLKIVAQGSGSSWNSGRIDTSGKQPFKYGYFEARIKLPVGYKATTESEENLLVDEEGNPVNNGVWPAFWMMPEDATDEDGKSLGTGGQYGVWPRSGEIDIMEYSPSTAGNSAYATLHHALSETDATDVYPSLGRKAVSTPTYDNDSDWHRYGLLWTSGTLEAFYDGNSLGTVYANGGGSWAKWPYDQDFYIILNLAMGGVLGGAINSGMRMAVYEIDYVRVYQ